ncbi:MAG: CRISPR-associated endoribonuclease Cas6 [Syntrophomonadaceae bacterium]|jgi:CRISPR-associated endoribonuclease Cas6
MRLKIRIESNKPIVLPWSYNHILQAWLYQQISDPAYRLFLHNEGYRYENRTFRLFTFSRLQGSWEADKEKKQIIFESPVYIQIASPLTPFMQQIAMSVLMGEKSYWGGNAISVTGVDVLNYSLPKDKQNWIVRTLSPIVIYSTLMEGDKKTTRYYRPDESSFHTLIKDNLRKKAVLLQRYYPNGYPALQGDFLIRPLFDPLKKGSTALYYKDFFIKGYMGDFELECDREWVKVALDTGLGAKNAQGLGMVKLL